MRALAICLISLCVCAGATTVRADSVIDCGKKSLAQAVRDVKDANQTITFTGVCVGSLVIAIDGLTLKGEGTAIIDGGGADAVTINGASRVALLNLEVTNGGNGIVAQNGAHVQLTDVNSHDNAGAGIVVKSASTAVLTGISATHNGGVGLRADDGAGIALTSSTISDNASQGISLTFGTRADLRTLVFDTYTCDATVLVRGASGIVCPH